MYITRADSPNKQRYTLHVPEFLVLRQAGTFMLCLNQRLRLLRSLQINCRITLTSQTNACISIPHIEFVRILSHRSRIDSSRTRAPRLPVRMTLVQHNGVAARFSSHGCRNLVRIPLHSFSIYVVC